MTAVVQSTLYVLTDGALVRKDGTTLQVEVHREVKLAVPIHQVHSLALFGNVMITPGALKLCADESVGISFLSVNGRFLARVEAPGSPGLLARREQFRRADDSSARLELARLFVGGKLQNARALLLRSGREAGEEDAGPLREAAGSIADLLPRLESAQTDDEVRGFEGMAARHYFGVFDRMVRQQRESFPMTGRSRRPPRDRLNALLSFVYSLLLHDCVSAVSAAGLDPYVGFLHQDRPGRPALALDLMEELRSLIADRLVLALVNRRQVDGAGFEARPGGAVQMRDATRRAVVTAYQKRKHEEVTHPFLEQACRVGMLPFLQARLLARLLRGDMDSYVPCVMR